MSQDWWQIYAGDIAVGVYYTLPSNVKVDEAFFRLLEKASCLNTTDLGIFWKGSMIFKNCILQVPKHAGNKVGRMLAWMNKMFLTKLIYPKPRCTRGGAQKEHSEIVWACRYWFGKLKTTKSWIWQGGVKNKKSFNTAISSKRNTVLWKMWSDCWTLKRT